jgi:hypothetical protein
MITGLGELLDATPDVASFVVNGTLTLVLFHPRLLGAGVFVPNASCGAVASRFTVTDCVVVPPAEVAEHVNVMPAVSAVTLLAPQP